MGAESQTDNLAKTTVKVGRAREVRQATKPVGDRQILAAIRVFVLVTPYVALHEDWWTA